MTQYEALQILKTGVNVFLTGEPGAGKTYVTNAYIDYLREHDIEPTITASTGIAATHLKGTTLHSFAGLGRSNVLTAEHLANFSKKPQLVKKIRKAKVLIIDEISMLSAEVLDSVNDICKFVRGISHKAFGGLQVVLVGDFFQLPPVTKEGETLRFAFESTTWQELNLKVCYIQEQYRQEDTEFLDLLRAIRTETITERHHELLEKRLVDTWDVEAETPKLFTHNIRVDNLNERALMQLEGKEHEYAMLGEGSPYLVENLKKGCLSPEHLRLKMDALVICTKNNSQVGYVNGTIGKVIGFDDVTDAPIIHTKEGKRLTIEPVDWSIEEEGKVRASIVQVPLRLAWAITIHKSQGMSLDSAVVDLSQTFEYGQGYVALSRVRNLHGLTLIGINDKALLVHPKIAQQDRMFHEESRDSQARLTSKTPEQLEELHVSHILRMGGSVAPKPKKQFASTYDETLQYIHDKKSLADIARIRGVQEGTIIIHIQQLLEDNKLKKEHVEYLITPHIASKLYKLSKAVEEHGSEKLKPLHEALKGELTYDEIKLGLIFA